MQRHVLRSKNQLSEKKASEKILEKLTTMEKTLTSRIEKLETQPKPETKAKTEPEAHKHFKVEDFNDDCPDCQKVKEKIGREHMKKAMIERKDLDHECVDCGTHVREEEEECPTCGGKEAKPR